MLRFALLFVLFLNVLPKAGVAQSGQDVVWVQIEARPTLEAARDRAEFFARTLPDVNGFALAGGWYAIALGPYTPSDAASVLESYRNQGLIPFDSYIAFSRTYGAQYWPPVEGVPGTGGLVAETPVTRPLAEETSPVRPRREEDAEITADTVQDSETPAQARRGESLLSAEERQDLQMALQWAGYYNAAIDGAFGRGTRNSMAAWQRANGFESTGILTTRQRALLMSQYNAILDGLEMELVRDLDAGIEIRMPTALVDFERYEAPFAHYGPTGDTPARVLLISQTGSIETLRSLYEIMQTLTIVPLDGSRRISGNQFTLVGRNTEIVSETRVERVGNEIKGFTLIWPTGDEQRRARVMEEMETSLVRRSGTLDPRAGITPDQEVDLISGLEVRKPILSRSGFFVDPFGAVVTTAEAVRSCTRITLDDLHDATLAGVDTDRGIALLTPKERLAPPAIARFSPVPPRLQSEVAVAGYSFEGQLGAPSMTFGTLSDLKGLRGETEVSRLALDALPGDAGGPVIDSNGNVFGMLLPPPAGSRQLPPEVRFALTSDAILNVLERAGLTTDTGDNTTSVDAIDITDRGVGMTVLVSCWE